jgi:pyruvate-formate lyase
MSNKEKQAHIPAQVDVNHKIPIIKSLDEQLDIMELYTSTHHTNKDKPKPLQESACLSVLYPTLFRPIENEDIVIGRLDSLAVGFGSVTSVGGVGHYGLINKLEDLKKDASDLQCTRIDGLIEYWNENDTREIFYKQYVKQDILGRFVDPNYPVDITARLSGMYLNYQTLIDHGISGLKSLVLNKLNLSSDSKAKALYESFLDILDLVVVSFDYHIDLIQEELKNTTSATRVKQLKRVEVALTNIKTDKPQNMIEAIELTWIYSLMAGVVNYGRIDDLFGPFLVKDLADGLYDQDEAVDIIASYFKLIESRRTTVNGRVIVGGKGRIHPEEADVFCLVSMDSIIKNKDTEPQYTLRVSDDMNQEVYDKALDTIAAGTTYPMLLNDDINISAVSKAMGINLVDAQQYVPFGCGEYVISGKSVGTPNVVTNLLKLLTISTNGGIDPWDLKNKSDGIVLKTPNELHSFSEVFEQYKRLINHYVDISAASQAGSYQVMNGLCSFTMVSLLSDSCLDNGRAVLDGGIKYLGGTNEMYGNANAADSLTAIKTVVFDHKSFTLSEVVDAAARNFESDHDKNIQKALLNAPKFGNDDASADDVAVELHEHVCNEVRNSAARYGLDSYLVVIINNQTNTDWGRGTAASYDGRKKGMYMAPGNNPQSGADKNGPTAMLNSLSKLVCDIHAGSVQNIKFEQKMFEKRNIISSLFKTYFDQGGNQLMVTVVGKEELQDAFNNPEKYPNLVVRVGGFSAKYVRLDRDVQLEILNRTLNG